jgi:hypothetical protein
MEHCLFERLMKLRLTWQDVLAVLLKNVRW